MECKGIYEILEKTNQKCSTGHYLYKVKCIICNQVCYKRMSELNRIVENCRHNWIEYKWNSKRLSLIYHDMKTRCYNSKRKDYKFYGGKGIIVCNEWLENPASFEKWAYKNGYKENLTIDRLNSNKNYCPENCRWLSKNNNSKYKSTTNIIEINNIRKSGREWSSYIGKSVNYINKMIRNKGLDKTITYLKEYIKE